MIREFTEIAQRSYDNRSQSPYITTSSNDMAHRVGLWCRDYHIYPQEVRESRGYTWIINRDIKLVDGLEDGATIDGDQLDSDDIRERIQEDPLSVEVRTDWHAPGDGDNKPTEYMILLCTGGPACRIVGDLDEYCQPVNAKIEYQDWFTPWTRYGDTTNDEDEKLLQYAQQFYYGG